MTGAGVASSATSSTIIMSSTWAAVVPGGTLPQTTPIILTASLAVLARRFRADPHEVGRIEGLRLDSWELVAASPRASTSRGALRRAGSPVGAGVTPGDSGAMPQEPPTKSVFASGPKEKGDS